MKRILFFLMAVVYSIVLQAAKAHPGPFTVTQSDGTQVTVKIHGDEDFHYYTTLDGVILFRDGNDYFVASISDNGEIINSGQLAHNASSRSTEEISIVSKQDKTKFFASATQKRNKAKANRTALLEDDKTLFPHKGNPKVLVALVQFSDVKFTVNEPKVATNVSLIYSPFTALGVSVPPPGCSVSSLSFELLQLLIMISIHSPQKEIQYFLIEYI